MADRVRLHGSCTPEELTALDLEHASVLCDCEGCELAVFTPEVVGRLSASRVLVELHDIGGESTEAAVLEGFAGTHEATVIAGRGRDIADYPELEVLSAARIADLLAPGQVILKLAVAGFGVTLPPPRVT